MPFLPTSKAENNNNPFDFICITGDAYVDHPSFGIAIISRMLADDGFSVGIIAQPQTDNDYLRLGTPRMGFMITGGNIDSMVSNYTVAGRKRSDDAYSEGGIGGKRPDRAVTVYSRSVKRLLPEAAVIIGGLEASLRRFAHYDFWADKILPSVLADSGADILLYGMCELTVLQLAHRLKAGEDIKTIRDLRGSCYLCTPAETPLGAVNCDSYTRVSSDKKAYAVSVRKQYDEQDEITGRRIVQRQGELMLVQNPPQRSLTQSEFDYAYALPYMKSPHPMYKKGVPSIEEVEFSIIHNRGCYGFCNFCSIALHQGRRVQTRSIDSVVDEAIGLTERPGFKGYIHDIGGPTANLRAVSCKKQLKQGMCKGKKCFSCPNLEVDHSEYIQLLRKVRALKSVKKVFVRSGVRYDLVNKDPSGLFLRELTEFHVSGQLKVAPEHCSPHVLDKMGKPYIEEYEKFKANFERETKRCGKEQYLIPYLMSSHPGSRLTDAVELACWLKARHIRPEQVQDFYPTPGTISTAMYYSGIDPYTLQPVFVPKSAEERAMQRALLQYYKPENRRLIRKALLIVNRADLIGNKPHCLISDNEKEKVSAPGNKKHNQKSPKSKQKQNKNIAEKRPS